MEISKKLKSVVSQLPLAVSLLHTNTGQDEAEAVAHEIVKMTSVKNRYKFGDIAILVRANNHADGFIREFVRQIFHNQFLGPSKLFEKDEIIDLISYLKILYNPGRFE